MNQFIKKWNRLYRKWKPTLDDINEKIVYAWDYVMKFKKLFLAAPVAAMAVLMAINNLFRLPALVGLGLQGDGEYAVEILREVAVVAPLLVTGICLLLMFASKRTLTPWMVSVFSLLLPWLILVTNTFLA